MTGGRHSGKQAIEPRKKSWLRRCIDCVVGVWTRIDRRLPDKPPSDDFTWTTKL